ncbi:hypothetical protein AMECASPLE_009624 [Ameca splendens]|uniref:Uncharacterized protein n=1 Tax=Ameca splendens TaxID=208324 RepID=A0ABV0YY72_9TELE
MALWSKSSPASFCLSRYAPPLRPPVRHAGHGNETFPLGGFIIPVMSELRRLLSCACSTVRPKWMTPTSPGRSTLGLTVPDSRLRSPTSQPQQIGLLLQLPLLPVSTTGFGDCRRDLICIPGSSVTQTTLDTVLIGASVEKQASPHIQEMCWKRSGIQALVLETNSQNITAKSSKRQRETMEGGQVHIVPSHYNWSVFSAACCCWPLGMAALHYSKKVKAANAAGDIEAAEDASTTAKILNIISFISGLIILSFVIFFEVTLQ